MEPGKKSIEQIQKGRIERYKSPDPALLFHFYMVQPKYRSQ